MPLRIDPVILDFNHLYTGIARALPKVGVDGLTADFQAAIDNLSEAYPDVFSPAFMERARFAPAIMPLRESLIGDVSASLWILLGTVELVLLIACANVANLFLVRTEGAQQERAVREALGASRADLVRTHLTESGVLAAVAGVVGLAIGRAGLQLTVGLAPGALPRVNEVGLALNVLAFTAAVTVFAAGLFGLLPMLRQPRVATVLGEGSRRFTGGRARQRVPRSCARCLATRLPVPMLLADLEVPAVGIQYVVAVVVAAATLVPTRIQAAAFELFPHRVGVEVLDPPGDVIDDAGERRPAGPARRLVRLPAAVADNDVAHVTDGERGLALAVVGPHLPAHQIAVEVAASPVVRDRVRDVIQADGLEGHRRTGRRRTGRVGRGLGRGRRAQSMGPSCRNGQALDELASVHLPPLEGIEKLGNDRFHPSPPLSVGPPRNLAALRRKSWPAPNGVG